MPTIAPTKPSEDTKTIIKRQPPYAVIVLNDDAHTFDYVITGFQKVFGYNVQKSFTLAKEINDKGRAIVWVGTLEVAELKKEQIESLGPDNYASRKVDFPLGVELEPMP